MKNFEIAKNMSGTINHPTSHVKQKLSSTVIIHTSLIPYRINF